jgi:hypothetical protein
VIGFFFCSTIISIFLPIARHHIRFVHMFFFKAQIGTELMDSAPQDEGLIPEGVISELWTSGEGEGVLDGKKDRRIVMPLVLRCPRDVVTCMFLFAPHASMFLFGPQITVALRIVADHHHRKKDWFLPPLASIQMEDIISRHLVQAIYHHEVDTVVILLKAIRCGPWRGLGLDMGKSTPFGSPLLVAAECGNLKIFNMIRRFTGVEMDPAEFVLHRAAERGHAGIIKVIVREMGVDVNLEDRCGDAAVHRAAAQGHASCLRTLHELGADMNKAENSSSGRTPVHLAALLDHALCIRALHELGADLNIRTSSGETPLGGAIWWNRQDCATFLRANGGV